MRRLVRATLEEWDLPELASVAELLTDELVANVVRHVGSPGVIRVTKITNHNVRARIEVDDPSPVLPVVHDHDPFGFAGRGLQLVNTIATQWGATLRPDEGKTVWFELAA
jgi:hypothetical protein